ncbi:MAG TPA: hypothetical protein VFB76_08665 [Candidatus Angelobacter sp.]|nr:hypothetical protein [Candidatus Angelobacter sp.]
MSKHLLAALLLSTAVSLTSAAQVGAQPNQEPETATHQQDFAPKLLVPHDVKVLPEESVREGVAANAPIGSAPINFASVNGCVIENQTIVGGCPQNGLTTNVPTIIVPVVFNLNSGVLVFNPTATDPGCLGGANTALSLFQNSPLVSAAHTFILNAENEGATQYVDAFTRAQFSHIKGAGYHVVLNPVTVGATLTVSVTGAPSVNADAFNFTGQCGTNPAPTNAAGDLGVVSFSFLNPLLQNYITTHAIPSTTFVYFLLYNTVISNGAANNLNNCCILGFHSAFGAGPNTYGIGDFEGRNGTLFGGTADTSVAAHEISEWLDDPFGNNTLAPVTPWGVIGQVSGCQSNLETGDPLTGTLIPAVALGGFNYHLQELAFFSWFTHDNPSLGAGGKYSDNGTFAGFAKACPPGGTN